MSLTLIDARRISVAVAHEEDPTLDVVAVIRAGGDSAYTEVILMAPDGLRWPDRMVIGITGDLSEPEFRSVVRNRLRRQLDEQ